jgi:hypothetical protein
MSEKYRRSGKHVGKKAGIRYRVGQLRSYYLKYLAQNPEHPERSNMDVNVLNALGGIPGVRKSN